MYVKVAVGMATLSQKSVQSVTNIRFSDLEKPKNLRILLFSIAVSSLISDYVKPDLLINIGSSLK